MNSINQDNRHSVITLIRLFRDLQSHPLYNKIRALDDDSFATLITLLEKANKLDSNDFMANVSNIEDIIFDYHWEFVLPNIEDIKGKDPQFLDDCAKELARELAYNINASKN